MSNSRSLVVDWDGLAENFEHDSQAMAMIVEIFLETITHTLENLRIAILNSDSRKIALASHNLKGAISNFGARDAVRLAQRLENIGIGHETGDAPFLFSRLEVEVKCIVDELNSTASLYISEEKGDHRSL